MLSFGVTQVSFSPAVGDVCVLSVYDVKFFPQTLGFAGKML